MVEPTVTEIGPSRRPLEGRLDQTHSGMELTALLSGMDRGFLGRYLRKFPELAKGERIGGLYVRKFPVHTGRKIGLYTNPYRIGFWDNDRRYGNHMGAGYRLGSVRGVPKGDYVSMWCPHLSIDHCQIYRDDDGTVYIEDLGSRTGTWVDGERVSEHRQTGKVELHDGAVINLVPTFLTRHFPERLSPERLSFQIELVYHELK